jgi:hypothetical protein
MDRIPHSYLKGLEGHPDGRETAVDFWAWLEQQPVHAWLFYARGANWDTADSIFESMVAHPRCDLAIASWLFWQSEPRYWLAKPEKPRLGTLLRAILDRCNQGGFPSGAVHYDRVEVAFHALQAAKVLSELKGPPPFLIPPQLIQSFDGSNPPIGLYEPEVERDLAEIFDDVPGKHSAIWGSFYRSDQEYFDANRRSGNWWFEPALNLPRNPLPGAGMSTIEAIDAVFGDHRPSVQRIEQQRLQSRGQVAVPSVNKWGMTNDPKQLAFGLGLIAVSAIGLLFLLWRWIAH